MSTYANNKHSGDDSKAISQPAKHSCENWGKPSNREAHHVVVIFLFKLETWPKRMTHDNGMIKVGRRRISVLRVVCRFSEMWRLPLRASRRYWSTPLDVDVQVERGRGWIFWAHVFHVYRFSRFPRDTTTPRTPPSPPRLSGPLTGCCVPAHAFGLHYSSRQDISLSRHCQWHVTSHTFFWLKYTIMHSNGTLLLYLKWLLL
jgi:hypothetical protein